MPEITLTPDNGNNENATQHGESDKPKRNKRLGSSSRPHLKTKKEVDLPRDNDYTCYLLNEYRTNGNIEAYGKLFDGYIDLARCVARNAIIDHNLWEDVCQEAAVALIKAIDNFDLNRNTKFTTYICATVRKEIKKYSRDYAWSVHVSRPSKERAYRVFVVQNQLLNERQQMPTIKETAKECNLSEKEVAEAMNVYNCRSTISLSSQDEANLSAGIKLKNFIDEADISYDQILDSLLLQDIMKDLPEDEREILRLRYEEDLVEREIGKRLGISQTNVSRKLSSALNKCQQISVNQQYKC